MQWRPIQNSEEPKVFGENAHRLPKEVLESIGIHLDMPLLYDIYSTHGCDPNIKHPKNAEGRSRDSNPGHGIHSPKGYPLPYPGTGGIGLTLR